MHAPTMTIAHRVRVAVDDKGQVQLQLPPEFEGTEAEIIVLAERRARSASPDPGRIDHFLELAKQFGKNAPAIPLEAMDRGDIYDRDNK